MMIEQSIIDNPPFDLEATEALRVSFRPDRIKTLFVGESAPASGQFFYDGRNSMARFMASALSDTHDDTFLDRFKALGWYLDDLVLYPINRKTQAERKAAWIASAPSLTKRTAEYQPQAIVSLLKGMKTIVEDAATASGLPSAGLHCCVSRHGKPSTLSCRDGGFAPSASQSLGAR